VHDDGHWLARGYHSVLVWDLMKKPALTRYADRALNPLIGKSLVVYATKPAQPAVPPQARQAPDQVEVARARS
jgi:hypothetical protein